MLIDTHCHLDLLPSSLSVEKLLSQASLMGVGQFIVPAIGEHNWQQVLELCRTHSGCYPAFGYHPLFLSASAPLSFERLSDYLSLPETVAVGEIGLDPCAGVGIEEQERILRIELQMAVEHQLPVIIHSRKTHDALLRLLRPFAGRLSGVIHGFSGSTQQAQHFVELGFKLGVGGVITYSRASKTQRAIAAMPLEALLLETDSPDMPPVGVKKGENTPLTLPTVLQALSELRREPVEEIAAQLNRNSQQLFDLQQNPAYRQQQLPA